LAANALGTVSGKLSARHQAVPLAKDGGNLEVYVIFDVTGSTTVAGFGLLKADHVDPLVTNLEAAGTGIVPVFGAKPRETLEAVGSLSAISAPGYTQFASKDLVWEIGDPGDETKVGRFDSEGQFKAGTYSVLITLNAALGYTFDQADDYSSLTNMKVVVNSGTSLTVRYTPTYSGVGLSTAAAGAVGGIYAPVTGQKVMTDDPDAISISGFTTSPAKVAGLDWFELLADGQTWVPINWTTDNRFKAGVVYSTILTLRADDGDGILDSGGDLFDLSDSDSVDELQALIDDFAPTDVAIEFVSISDSGKEIVIRLIFPETF